jgi:hypothetical protein
MQWSLAGGDDEKVKRLRTRPAMAVWTALRSDLRESNCQQADAIPARLRNLNMYMAEYDPAKDDFEVTDIPPDEVDKLAEQEHERYVAERLTAGWTVGPRDTDNATTPFLEPWCDVEPMYQDYDREAIRAIPRLLRQVGYRIYRMPEIEKY